MPVYNPALRMEDIAEYQRQQSQRQALGQPAPSPLEQTYAMQGITAAHLQAARELGKENLNIIEQERNRQERESIADQTRQTQLAGSALSIPMQYQNYKLMKGYLDTLKPTQSAVPGVQATGTPATGMMPAVQPATEVVGEAALPATVAGESATGEAMALTPEIAANLAAVEGEAAVTAGALGAAEGASAVTEAAMAAEAMAPAFTGSLGLAPAAMSPLAPIAIGVGLLTLIPGVNKEISKVMGEVTGGTVICSELSRQGLLPRTVVEKDSQYRRKHIDGRTYVGYLMLFTPIALRMRKSKVLTALVYPFGRAAAFEMAHRVDNTIPGSILGKIILAAGKPFCKAWYIIQHGGGSVCPT